MQSNAFAICTLYKSIKILNALPIEFPFELDLYELSCVACHFVLFPMCVVKSNASTTIVDDIKHDISCKHDRTCHKHPVD